MASSSALLQHASFTAKKFSCRQINVGIVPTVTIQGEPLLNLAALPMAFMLFIVAPVAASACYVTQSGEPDSPNGAVVSITYNPKFGTCSGIIKVKNGSNLKIAYKPRLIRFSEITEDRLRYTIGANFSGKDLGVITAICRGKPVKVRFHFIHADLIPAANRWW